MSAASARRKSEAENQIAAAPAALAAAGRDGDELFAVHHVHGRRGIDARAGVELPQLIAGLRVVGVEVACGVAAAADEHDAAAGHDRARLRVAVEHLLPHELSRGRIERRQVATRWTSAAERI